MDLLKMSLSATLLIAVIAAARFFWRSRIPGTVMDILWGVACCKLLIPADLFSPVRELLYRALRAIWPLRPSGGIAGMERLTEGAVFPAPTIGFYVMESRDVADIRVLPFVWLAGVLCLTLYFVGTYLHYIRIVRMSLPAEGIRDRRRYEICFPGRRVRVRMSDRIVSPLTFGIFRPVILLPPAAERKNGNGLTYVMEHERAHIRRLDSVRKLLLAAALVCHWFNPAVWGMYFLANRDIELACDEAVLRMTGREHRAVYANVLLEWEAARPEPGLLVSHFMGNFLEERIRNIMNKRKITIAGVILSVMLISGTAVVYAMTPADEKRTGVTAAAGDAYENSVTTTVDTTTSSDGKGTDSVTTTIKATTPEDEKRDDSVAASEQPGDAEGRSFVSYVEDPTLGGIFETYTVEEYEAVLEQVKLYADGDDGTHSGYRAMEEALEKLKADNGKGEFVIYKAAFEKTWEEDGYWFCSGFNPIIVMAPELEYRDATMSLTVENYRKDIEKVTGVLDEAVADGQLTPENREIILGKMNDNLKKLK